MPRVRGWLRTRRPHLAGTREGNANHPLNLGKTCARGQATLHGLYNPDRVTDPIQRKRGNASATAVDWDSATQTVADALTKYQPNEIAFLMGTTSDHLFDLVADLSSQTGINPRITRHACQSRRESLR